MENVADSLKIGFAVMIFVIGLSLAFFMISQTKSTADTVFSVEDDSKYFQDGLEGVTFLSAGENKRIVGWETVIPAIFRAQKENYSVTIVSKNTSTNEYDNIYARFSIETETIVARWNSPQYQGSKENHLNYLNKKVFGFGDTYNWEEVFKKIYNTGDGKIGAPWLTNNVNDQINRIKADLLPNGASGYSAIYTGVSYQGLELLKDLSGKNFKENLHIIEDTQENGAVDKKVEIIYEVI